jgi:hypothetical protein
MFCMLLHHPKLSYSKFVSSSSYASYILLLVITSLLSFKQLGKLTLSSPLHYYKWSYSKFESDLVNYSN